MKRTPCWPCESNGNSFSHKFNIKWQWLLFWVTFSFSNPYILVIEVAESDDNNQINGPADRHCHASVCIPLVAPRIRLINACTRLETVHESSEEQQVQTGLEHQIFKAATVTERARVGTSIEEQLCASPRIETADRIDTPPRAVVDVSLLSHFFRNPYIS